MIPQTPQDPWLETHGPIFPPPPLASTTPTEPPTNPAVVIRLVLAWSCIAVCTVVLIFLQSFGMKMAQEAYAEDTRPGYMALYLGRYATGLDNLIQGAGAPMMREFDAAFAGMPHPVENEIRSVILAAEIEPGSLDNRVARLRDLREQVDSEAYGDSELVIRIYSNSYTPTDAERDTLKDNHGWFGEIAASYNAPSSSSAYRSPRRSATYVLVGILAFGLTVLITGLTGFVLAVIAIVMLCLGKLRAAIASGAAGHQTAYLETAALFLLMFIVLQVVLGLIQEITGVDMVLPILLLTTLPIGWPLLMRVPWNRFKQDMGIHAGRGLFREIAAGFVGYIAGLPIIAIGIGITVLLSLFAEAQPDHPLQYELLDGGMYTILVTLGAAVIWAPIVEELVFRSAFYRHLRQRRGVVGLLLATSVTAFVFAAIHPQGWLGVPALMSIAFVLSGMREWRGSIIPSMVAHAIHNGAISTLFAIVLFA